MDTKNPACAGCRRVLQLPVHARNISGMGCRSHRVLQGILPLHLRDSLPDCNGGNTDRHTEFSDILTVKVMKRITEYNKTGNRPVQRAALERRLFLFADDTQRMNRFKIEITQNNQTIHVPMNYRAKVADASYRQARSGLAVSWEKSSSPKGCGIFPENLACRKHPLLPPYSSTGHVKPEYSPLKLKSMEQQAIMASPVAPMTRPVPARIRKITPPAKPFIKLPPRGTTGPVPVSALLEPLQRIIHHPDRNRLLAEFFKEA